MKCIDKKIFYTRSGARKVAKFIKLNRKQEELYCYLCSQCGYFHLTSMPREEWRNMMDWKREHGKL